MAEHLFLTGGTGFIGSRLLRLWLERTEARVTLLLRDREGEPAAGRLDSLLAGCGVAGCTGSGRRVDAVTGDLTAPGLGLDPAVRERLAANLTHIVHAGADLHFNLSLAGARRTNVAGTAAVLDLARDCVRLELLSHLGTAYAAGQREGLVLEESDGRPAHHRNTYERSKHEAEQLVRRAMAGLPAVVLRPTIVTCDLETGFAPATSGFCRVLQGIGSGVLRALPGRPGVRLDLVPVDYVVEAAFALGMRADLAGRCFHLGMGQERAIALDRLVALACERFGRARVRILPPGEFRRWADSARRAVPAAAPLLDEIAHYEPYLTDHPVFDNAGAMAALAGVDLPTVEVTAYLNRVVEYLRQRDDGSEGTLAASGR